VNCLEQETLIGFLSESMSAAESAEVAAHLNHCAICQARFEQLCEDPYVLECRDAYLQLGTVDSPSGIQPIVDWAQRQGPGLRDESISTVAKSAMDESTNEYPALPLLPEHFGPFKIIRPLGRGGMGEVYLALQSGLNRQIALKVIRSDRQVSARTIERFKREMEAIGKLHHPHVVQAFDAGAIEGVHYLAMELVDGQDVEEIARIEGRLRVSDACEIVRQAALGLAHAHAHQLLHRDIKPSNLLLSRTGVVKLTDLGLARALQGEAAPLTNSNVVVGTFDYMPPEHAQGAKTWDERSDLYSLGCLLYRLIAGRAPFQTARFDSPSSKLLAHVNVVPETLSSLRPEVPLGLSQLVDKLLAKIPSQRIESAGLLAEALAEFIDSPALSTLCESALAKQPVHRKLEGRPQLRGLISQPLRPRLATRPKLVGIAVAFVLFAALLGGGAYYSVMGNSEAAQHQIVPELSPPDQVLPPRVDLLTAATGKWHNLLEHPPVELKWSKGPGSSEPKFDAKRNELLAISNGTGLLELGETHAKSYRVQIAIRQAHWEGGIGLFFGFHQVPPTFVDQQCQIIYLSKHPFKKRYYLRRAVYNFPKPPAALSLKKETFGQADIPIPDPHEHFLEITIVNQQLTRVTWDGQDLPGLVQTAVKVDLLPEDFAGKFGFYLGAASGTLSSARAMIYEIEK